jgi:hypothetical protein
MDQATVTAMAGALGSLVGGSATVATTWLTHRTQTRREFIRLEMRKREMLYGEFIGVCAKLIVDAFTHTLDKPETLLPLYALTNRIRLSASQPVLAAAEALLRHITDQYFSTNLTLEQMRALARSEQVDPLKSFGEACRAELKAMRARV